MADYISRDCEYIYTDGDGHLACVKSGLYPDENDYCSRGQRANAIKGAEAQDWRNRYIGHRRKTNGRK